MQPQTDWPNANGDVGKPMHPDPNAFKEPHGNPEAVEHQAIEEGGKNAKAGGKDMGLVDPPIVSLNPTSATPANEADDEHFEVIDAANLNLGVDTSQHIDFKYPFADLETLQGFFVPVKPGNTTDKLMMAVHKQITQYVKQVSVPEKDEDGDDVLEDVAINKKKRNDDGTVQLDGDTPRLGIKSGFRPKLIGPTFTAKAVVKGDQLSENNEADSDGVLVIRMS